MKITRTYPQPDSPSPHLGARERALAVFKYLLDLEPEAAIGHPLFACIVHSYEQVAVKCFEKAMAFEEGRQPRPLGPSVIAELSSTRELSAPTVTPYPDDGGL